jgi:hypothetical protein
VKPNRRELEHDLNEIFELVRRWNNCCRSIAAGGQPVASLEANEARLYEQMEQAKANFIEKHGGPDTEYEQRELKTRALR